MISFVRIALLVVFGGLFLGGMLVMYDLLPLPILHTMISKPNELRGVAFGLAAAGFVGFILTLNEETLSR